MRLKSLKIHRGYFGEKPLQGEIEFSSQKGEIKLILDEEFSQKVVALCADAIVEAAQYTAENMTAEIITALPAPDA